MIAIQKPLVPQVATEFWAYDIHLTDEKREQSKLSHTMCFCAYRLQDRYLCARNITRLRQALVQHFRSSSFSGTKCVNTKSEQFDSSGSPDAKADELDSMGLNLFLLPYKVQDESQRCQYESFMSALGKLRDQVIFYLVIFIYFWMRPGLVVLLMASSIFIFCFLGSILVGSTYFGTFLFYFGILGPFFPEDFGSSNWFVFLMRFWSIFFFKAK